MSKLDRRMEFLRRRGASPRQEALQKPEVRHERVFEDDGSVVRQGGSHAGRVPPQPQEL